MSEPIKPALTAEEWELRLAGNYSGERGEGVPVIAGGNVAITYDGGLAAAPTDDNHAIAAIALYGQEFGFTRADVELLRYASSGRWETGSVEEAEAEEAAMRDLADRIEALLPPEDYSHLNDHVANTKGDIP
jgi:hypothetical protein